MTSEIRHRTLPASGIEIHVAEAGDGPLVLMCHGWPELWYSWRHQLAALAGAGFRAVAPDMRGFGQTTAPDDAAAYTILHNVGDMVALVAALGETCACIIGHDWGASVAWSAALMRPDLFTAVAALSVPFRPRNPAAPPMTMLKAAGLENFYWFYFNREGVPEAEFERDLPSALRRVLVFGSGDAPADRSMSMTVAPGAGFLDRAEDPQQLPSWLSAQDIEVYAAGLRTHGLRGPFSWYRNIDRNWGLLAPFQGAKVLPPALFIAGARDAVIASPMGRGALESLQQGVPNLRDKVLIPGAGHWIQQERPAEVTAALLKFLGQDYPASAAA